MTPIIEARGLGKRYRLGLSGHKKDETFRELIMRLVKAPFSRRGGADDGDSGHHYLWALKDLDFDVQEADVVGIIGRNGAGKSTLLKVLSRITEPTTGSVIVRGRLASLLEVGTGFHPELTGRENIFLNGAILGMRKAEIEAKFDEIVSFSEIEEFLDTPVKRYSSGMYVRLAFAVAAHLEPEILVVDEVLAVGDIAFQKKCLGKMSEVSRGGRTVLFVSHNMSSIDALCSRAIVLDRGGMIFNGEVAEAIQHYVDSFAEHEDREEGHIVDLAEASGRLPTFKPVVKRLELYSTDDRPVVGGVPVGSPLKVRLIFEADRVVPEFDMMVWFETLVGQVVLTTSTFFEPEHPKIERAGEQSLLLEIPRLTLVPGEYRLKVRLHLGREVADIIEDATRVTVLPSNFYGTGRMPSSGSFLLEQRWTLE
jgi:lipopolysaccharide transport system ATP-binding protein